MAVIGLVIGLALGIFISVILNLPNVILPTQSGVGMSNQVQVSGTVQVTQTGTIYFLQTPWDSFIENETIRTSSPIVDGKYSVLLVGGKSYDIFIDDYPSYWDEDPDYVLYVPAGVTTFTADF